jgi:hypothetical protein
MIWVAQRSANCSIIGYKESLLYKAKEEEEHLIFIT